MYNVFRDFNDCGGIWLYYLKTIFVDRRTGERNALKRVKGSARDVSAVDEARDFARLDSYPRPRRRDGRGRAPAYRQQVRDRNPRERYHGTDAQIR